MIRALLATRLQSGVNRIRTGPWGLFQAVVLLGGILVAAAYQGRAIAAPLIGERGAQAWISLREGVFLCVAIQGWLVAYRAMESLLRPADGELLLTLPVGPGPRYLVAALDTLWWTLPAPLVVVALFAPLGFLGEPLMLVRALALVGVGYLLAIASGLSVAAAAGRISASTRGTELKRLLAGGWVSPERAAFLYAPAVAGGIAGVLCVPVQVSLDEWPVDPPAAAIGLVLIAAVALVGLVVGAVAYVRGFARLGPALATLDARDPLAPKAGAEGSVYGVALIGRLRGSMGAVALRDLLSIRRRHRAEPLVLFLAAAAAAVVLDRAGADPRTWAVGAVAVGLFSARTGVRLGERDLEVGWLALALPISWFSLVRAKISVALLHVLHAVVPFCAVAAIVGAPPLAILWCATTGIAASAFGPSLSMATSGRGGVARGLYLPIGFGLCLLALAAPAGVPAVLAGLTAAAALVSRRTLQRGTR